MIVQAEKPTATAKPERLHDVPEYRAAADKMAALIAERDQLRSRKAELSEELRDTLGVVNIIDEIEAKLRLEGDPEPPDHERPRKELARVSHELFIVEQAIDREERIVSNAQLSASALICETFRPRYEQVTQAMAEALEALEQAVIDEYKHRHELQENGIAFSSTLPPTLFPGAIDVVFEGEDHDQDHVGEIRAWFYRAREAGHKV